MLKRYIPDVPPDADGLLAEFRRRRRRILQAFAGLIALTLVLGMVLPRIEPVFALMWGGGLALGVYSFATWRCPRCRTRFRRLWPVEECRGCRLRLDGPFTYDDP